MEKFIVDPQSNISKEKVGEMEERVIRERSILMELEDKVKRGKSLTENEKIKFGLYKQRRDNAKEREGGEDWRLKLERLTKKEEKEK